MARRNLPGELLTRARAGGLTRANTVKGTDERRAVYRIEAERRTDPRKLEQFGITRAQALGHPPAGKPSLTEIQATGYTLTLFTTTADGPATVTLPNASYREAQRAGRYMHLVGDLLANRISPEEFERRTKKMAPIAGHRPISDPRVVLAAARSTPSAEIMFVSKRNRRSLRRAA